MGFSSRSMEIVLSVVVGDHTGAILACVVTPKSAIPDPALADASGLQIAKKCWWKGIVWK